MSNNESVYITYNQSGYIPARNLLKPAYKVGGMVEIMSVKFLRLIIIISMYLLVMQKSANIYE
jgi:hypothetical protein